MGEISVEALSWRQWSEWAATWGRIYELCPDASFFVSREWVDCWLATFGEDLNPDLLTFTKEGEAVGCCLLVWRTEWVRGIPLRRVYLNCAGENEADSTCIEYNSLLSLPVYAEEVAKALGTYLRERPWDELHLSGVVEHSPICAVAASLGSNESSTRPSYFVDLARLRGEGAGFGSVLSPNHRRQILRSREMYEQKTGPCTLHVAATGQEAAGIFERLVDLHQAAWRDRGQPGAFASARFTGFHERLIEAAFAHDRILLVELRAGTEMIGALYSFVERGRVYFYQSGFRYAGKGRQRPGFLTHYLAIGYCLEKSSLREYDFLAGDSQYKRSLGNASRTLKWIVVRRCDRAGSFVSGFEMGETQVCSDS